MWGELRGEKWDGASQISSLVKAGFWLPRKQRTSKKFSSHAIAEPAVEN